MISNALEILPILIPMRSIKLNSLPRKVALLSSLAILLFANYVFGKWALANMASTHADVIDVADLAIQLAPDDPQTHYAAAVLYERSLLPDEIAKGLTEYSQAAALSPNNYLFWLDLGNARVRDGDIAGGARALRTAAELAPGYASVQWSLGNALLRQGDVGEGFANIHKAAVVDPEYAPAGANIAWQYFGGDIVRIHDAIGDSPAIVSALVQLLAGQKRVNEALSIWNTLPVAKNEGQPKQSGTTLYNELIAAKRFRDAANVYGNVSAGTAARPEPGKIVNGDFEGDIKTQAGSAFEWAIADGGQPQIALTDGQKHDGRRSLLLIFGTGGTSEFRAISQTIPVEPGRYYEFEAFYRADIQTSASLQWEAVDAADGKVLAATSKVAAAQDWTKLTVSFAVPAATDGIALRLVKNDCSGTCSVAGKIWFDDLALKAR